MGYIYCKNCGCKMSDKSEACPECGTVVETVEEQQQQAPSPIQDNEQIVAQEASSNDTTEQQDTESGFAQGEQLDINAQISDSDKVEHIRIKHNKRLIPIIAGSAAIVLCIIGIVCWVLLRDRSDSVVESIGSQNSETLTVVDFKYLFGIDRDKMYFQFDEDGNLISPRKTLIHEEVNGKLKQYTYDLHSEGIGEDGICFDLTECFSFNTNNELVKYENYDTGYIVEYEDGKPNRGCGYWIEDVEGYIYDNNKRSRKVIASANGMVSEISGRFDEVYEPNELVERLPQYYYPVAERIWLRSSPDKETDDNKIELVEYGTRMQYITTSYNRQWLKVHVKGGEREGYVSRDFVWREKDYLRFNSMFGQPDIRDNIPDAAPRKVILEWLREKHMMGRNLIEYNDLFDKYFSSNVTMDKCKSVYHDTRKDSYKIEFENRKPIMIVKEKSYIHGEDVDYRWE